MSDDTKYHWTRDMDDNVTYLLDVVGVAFAIAFMVIGILVLTTNHANTQAENTTAQLKVPVALCHGDPAADVPNCIKEAGIAQVVNACTNSVNDLVSNASNDPKTDELQQDVLRCIEAATGPPPSGSAG